MLVFLSYYAVFVQTSLQLRKSYQRQRDRCERQQKQISSIFNTDQLEVLQRYPVMN